MSPIWRFLCLPPLAALALWAAQVAVTNRWAHAGFQRAEAAAPGVARTCAHHVRAVGTLDETGMAQGFTALTDGGMTRWNLTAGWRAPDGRTRTLRCEAREEGGQLTVLDASLSWTRGPAEPTR